jgi:hypothetical protein
MVEKSDRRILATASGPTGSNTLFDNPDCPVFFVEGVGQLAMGPAVSKLRFFRVKYGEATPDGFTNEEREISLNVVIPTVSLLEWVSNLNASLAPAIDSIDKASQSTIAMLRSATKSEK